MSISKHQKFLVAECKRNLNKNKRRRLNLFLAVKFISPIHIWARPCRHKFNRKGELIYPKGECLVW